MSNWEIAWSQSKHRKLDQWDVAALYEILPKDWRKLRLDSVAITTVPKHYIDLVSRCTRTCPSCGSYVGPEMEILVMLYPTTKVGKKSLTVGIGCWMHTDCFDKCDKSNENVWTPW